MSMQIFSSSDIVMEHPFRVHFEGEKGVDTRGLTREAFSTFWELIYEKHFHGSAVLTSLMSTTADISTLQILGRILSFGCITCDFLTVRIAFPTLASILLSPVPAIPPDMLVETLRVCLNPIDTVIH